MLRAHIARTAFLIFTSGMREPSLQDRIGVRAFFVVLSPTATETAEAEKLGKSRQITNSYARHKFSA